MDAAERKRVLVTGATSGIGAATARRLLTSHFDVAVMGRRVRELEGLEAFGKSVGGNVLVLPCDLADRAATDRALKDLRQAWPELHGIVANAGVGGPSTLEAPDTRDFDRIFEINFTSHLRIVRCLIPTLEDGGRIVAVASVLGRFGIPRYHAYCASKAALIGLCRALALELASRRITVNAVAPGWVRTPMAESGMAEQAREAGLTLEEARKAFLADVPLGRMLEPEEVAMLILMLFGPAAGGITGQALTIDCGVLA